MEYNWSLCQNIPRQDHFLYFGSLFLYLFLWCGFSSLDVCSNLCFVRVLRSEILTVMIISVLNKLEIKSSCVCAFFSSIRKIVYLAWSLLAYHQDFWKVLPIWIYYFFFNFEWWHPKLCNGIIRNGYLCVPSVKQDETCSIAWCRLETAKSGMTFSSSRSWVSVEICFCFQLPDFPSLSGETGTCAPPSAL